MLMPAMAPDAVRVALTGRVTFLDHDMAPTGGKDLLPGLTPVKDSGKIKIASSDRCPILWPSATDPRPSGVFVVCRGDYSAPHMSGAVTRQPQLLVFFRDIPNMWGVMQSIHMGLGRVALAATTL